MSNGEIMPPEKLSHVKLDRKQFTWANPGEYMLGPHVKSNTDLKSLFAMLFKECGVSDHLVDQLEGKMDFCGEPGTTTYTSIYNEASLEIFSYRTYVEYNRAASEAITSAKLDRCDAFVYVVDLYHDKLQDDTLPMHKTFLEEDTAQGYLIESVKSNSKFVQNGGKNESPKFSTIDRLKPRLSYLALPKGEKGHIVVGVIRKIAIMIGGGESRDELFEAT
ncbi:hypothetical protein T440DRAFT_515073 [Plenodomus tracheiphilus IPT5]|uniref:Uncharacterized protein n=1 Tax=Plenodomus tracheiphilus IPT5 TaxID=1408161 RepID=A0A6A7BG23_9PLEO|nr:hypothetical protein T440DRAFT_515073 [Plenodomus tracheiphilus IPT5]